MIPLPVETGASFWPVFQDLVRMGPMLEEAGFIPLDEIQQAFEALVKPSTQLQMVVRI